MNKWIRRGAIAAGALVLLVGAAAFTGVQLADRKMNRQVEAKVRPVAFRTDAQAVERGKYLFASRGCVDCHGANGGGHLFLDNGSLRIKGPNLTNGPGGLPRDYAPEHWERAIRHGIAPSGRPLMIMPSEDYNRFTDDDLSALVAYVRQLPPVPGTGAEITLPLPVKALYGFGMIQDAAAKIDHTLPPQAPVAEGVTLEHGKYVANMCMGCHGPQLAGGKIPGGPPDWPAASNLTPGAGSVLPQYPDAKALQTLFRTGKRADGSAVKVMPFNSLGAISDTDVAALHLYLKSLPPVDRR